MLSEARGACLSIFVYDIAFSIDLNEAAGRITSVTQRGTIRHNRRAPRYFEFHPAPLRFIQDAGSISIAAQIQTNPQVELVVYDFGAVSVIYRIPINGDLSYLLSLSQILYENEQLLNDSRQRVEQLAEIVRPAVSKSAISSFVEDYIIFQLESFPHAPISEITTRYSPRVAQILRAEDRELSEDEVTDALSHRISYGKDDIAIIDWNAALVVDREPEDVLAVLEYANVELLELRLLDRQLDDALTLAYDRLSKRPLRWVPFASDPSELRDISQWQVDSAILFEGVNNVLKLLGDQYLSRLYRLIAGRFHLSEWDASIFRKLETLQSIYQKISDRVVSRRMEVLEWIIILLIAISIVLPFFSSTLGAK